MNPRFIILSTLFLSVSSFASPISQEELIKKDVAYENSRLDIPSNVAIKKNIRLHVNSKVRKWIRYFAVKDRKRFQRFLNRGQKYRNMVESTLRRYQIPEELFYLAMIESGYHPHSVSPMKAVGIWQFIRSTGSRYGLNANFFVDERRDPIQATDAAARHLRDLKKRFKSWYLAIAAYNAGSKRILGAIRNQKTRNFWTLVERKALPRETREYVPKFLAAVIIGRHPTQFGFQVPLAEPYPSIVAVSIPSPIHLRDVARLSRIPHESLERLNPAIRRGLTDPGKTNDKLWVPSSAAEKVAKLRPWFKRLLAKGVYASPKYASLRKWSRPKTYRVRKGDSLIKIAAKHRVSVAHLKQINDLKSNRIRAGKEILISYR